MERLRRASLPATLEVHGHERSETACKVERGLMTTSADNQKLGPNGHNAPCSNKDFDFFYRGLEEGQLLAQKCAACGVLRNPPSSRWRVST